MDGLEIGERYDTMGLRGNDLRHLYYKDIRVPPENVLGEPGDGFQIAMQVLNNGRLSLGTGSVGAAKKFLDVAIQHVTERRQFGRPLAEFELVQEKIGWMVSFLFGLESMTYLTTGLVDADVPDYRSSRLSARWPAPSSSGIRETVRCNWPGGRAICAITPTSRRCATSACSRSSRAPTTCCERSSR
jgi:acyl-CoA dehydrogenase family protein 9